MKANLPGNWRSRRVIVGNLNLPVNNYDCFAVKDLNAVEFWKCFQESFLNQYLQKSARKGAVLDLILE